MSSSNKVAQAEASKAQARAQKTEAEKAEEQRAAAQQAVAQLVTLLHAERAKLFVAEGMAHKLDEALRSEASNEGWMVAALVLTLLHEIKSSPPSENARLAVLRHSPAELGECFSRVADTEIKTLPVGLEERLEFFEFTRKLAESKAGGLLLGRLRKVLAATASNVASDSGATHRNDWSALVRVVPTSVAQTLHSSNLTTCRRYPVAATLLGSGAEPRRAGAGR